MKVLAEHSDHDHAEEALVQGGSGRGVGEALRRGRGRDSSLADGAPLRSSIVPACSRTSSTGRWKALDDAFFAVLEFGTGGRRGMMYPVGTNVLNERTIGESARGLADYVTARKGPDSPRSCVIARDCRHNSKEFAELCARVLAAAGFKVFLFQEARSTPLLSFAVRHLRLRCRHHDHRLAQSAGRQRLQVLRGDRRSGDSARR